MIQGTRRATVAAAGFAVLALAAQTAAADSPWAYGITNSDPMARVW